MSPTQYRLSSFSILLIMGALMITGAAMIPLLNIHYVPLQRSNSLTISYSWPGASARAVEQDVTSRIEGAVAVLKDIEDIHSVSKKGSGSITAVFKKGTQMDVVRFETATQIRHAYKSLPMGVSYPLLSGSTSGLLSDVPIINYTINADMSAYAIGKYVDTYIVPALSQVPGVKDVAVRGVVPFHYVITFDPVRCRMLGLSPDDMILAFRNHYSDIDMGVISQDDNDGANPLSLMLVSPDEVDFENIPIKRSAGRIVYFKDIAEVDFRETDPQSYYRVNGLTTISINISGERNINLITTAREIRSQMDRLGEDFPETFSASVSYDASTYVNRELTKVFFRAILSLIILLLFVLAISRNFRYLLIIFITLAANILIAVILYNLLDLSINIYSLAGITVSLSIIIDTFVMMTDHYSFYGDKKIFASILAALLTTIAALAAVFLLPESIRQNMVDFALILIINLSVSLFISYLFIPSLLDKLRLKRNMTAVSIAAKKRVVKFNRYYYAFIAWGRRHKWIFVAGIILGFGLPIHLLPSKLENKEGSATAWTQLYNKTIGSRPYQRNKATFEKILGGSYRYFDQRVIKINYAGSMERRNQLFILAGMHEGCTVHQLNAIIGNVENYLAQFEEIESFVTSVNSHKNASIVVTFRPEFEYSEFPALLKTEMMDVAMENAGATWSVYGINQNSFSNDIAEGYKPHRIKLTGYNYDILMDYALELAAAIGANARVGEPAIYSNVEWSVPQNEFVVDIDWYAVAQHGINIEGYFNNLRPNLLQTNMGSLFIDEQNVSISLVSSEKDRFDLWNVRNVPINVDSSDVKLSSFATIFKRPTGIEIIKENQSYALVVAFNFIGEPELARRLIRQNIERLNDDVLPIGFKASGWSLGSDTSEEISKLLIILLVIVVIYFVCSIFLESLTRPLLIIMTIPVSFIGVFLTFGLFGIRFDQGGFVSLIFLAGIAINAGIYIINEYNSVKLSGCKDSVRVYIRASNRKMTPILITITSSILGLVPFLINGKHDPFWHSFAAGTIGGMLFSIVALVIFLPIFFQGKLK